ncbi:hypothetical protein HYFRA_00005671 [Hymenoscyphus fraxineus]|uniref:Lysophospholipase n=1 Tax=Hymenoscyphus fraxineus TaxID=746836 RepID=A0A9N9KUQ0_9HELO|nr:hypothetical protein HYFRA_00005671 [Hymenoscyphus fraxineus]
MIFPIVLSLLVSSTVASSLYDPNAVACPSGSLIRDATGLSDKEEEYRVKRKATADVYLKAWLRRTHRGFSTSGELPTIALASSGGSYRAMLSGAGVVQGLDARDSNVSTSGLFQALTYHAGISGGSWLLSSLAGNNYPTISSLRDTLWAPALANSLLLPGGALFAGNILNILHDIVSKEAAGYDTTIVDLWGRLLSYQLLSGPSGGEAKTLSGITSSNSFISHEVPFPIITAIGARVWDGECVPGFNGTSYEFSPYEFGSWDKDISAFTPTQYLGTSLRGGKPSTQNCTTNYDNLGYIFGTSSDIFPSLCKNFPTLGDGVDLAYKVEALLNQVHQFVTQDKYAHYKNPFYEYKSETQTFNSANNISAHEQLSLADGGITEQNVPVLPFLQPARNVSVIIANDNSADTEDNWPNGLSLYTTYMECATLGLDRMPFIPPPEEFIAKGLNKKAVFFGCEDLKKVTIVYLPNRNWTTASNVSTTDIQYSRQDTAALIENGLSIVTQGKDDEWGVCMGCAIMGKSTSANKLPEECKSCFEEFCYVAGV